MQTLKWLIPNAFVRNAVVGMALSGLTVFAYYSGESLGRLLYLMSHQVSV